MMTLVRRTFEKALAERPDAPAILTERGAVSYRQLDQRVRQAVEVLWPQRAWKGELVVATALTDFDTWVLIFSLEALGAIVSSPPLPLLGRQAQIMGARACVCPPGTAVAEGIPVIHVDAAWFALLSERPVASEAELVARSGSSPMLLLMTSGTTGRPKLIALTPDQMETRLAQVLDAGRYTAEHPHMYVGVGAYSFAHLVTALCVWRMGGALCSIGGGTPLTPTLHMMRATSVIVPPVLLQQLVLDVDNGQPPFPGATLFIVGGTPAPTLRARAKAIFKTVVLVYGSTEAGDVAVSSLDDLHGAEEVAGILNPWVDARIVQEDGRDAAAGEVGELWVRLPGMVPDYYDAPDAVMFGDGWFHTRDLATLSADRVLRVLGRLDELIVFGDGKIIPSVLEGLALETEGVVDAAAFVAPVEYDFPVLVMAFQEAEANSVDEADLVASLKRYRKRLNVRLARTDLIPRNALGKIERSRLREAYTSARQAVARH